MNSKEVNGRLEELISKMDVPVFRIHDVGWLVRNLGIRNSKHENFKEAMELLKPLAKKIMKKNELSRYYEE